MTKYDCFHPGKVWLDTKGERIHAHGGSILHVDDTYYWYGENKEKSTPGSGIWHWGIRCYRSEDLYNWEDLGNIVPPETQNPDHPLHYTQCVDRPHILFHKKDRKYVMWIKVMDKKNLSHQYMVVLTADAVTGPYKLRKTLEPLQMSSGDFDLVIDDETQKGYIYFDKVHSEMICAELTEDYTDVTGIYSSHLKQPFCPLVREAPAFFQRNDHMYLLTSATTGYFPNPTECAVSRTYHGPWTNLGAIHENDAEHLSFRSQISSVFKHPKKKDLYIALADRWLTNLPEELPHNLMEIMISFSDPNQTPLISMEEYQKIWSYNTPETRDTSLADYVWLPVEFRGDVPYIKWYDSWRIEDFE